MSLGIHIELIYPQSLQKICGSKVGLQTWGEKKRIVPGHGSRELHFTFPFFDLISHLISNILFNSFLAVLGGEGIKNAGRGKEREQNKLNGEH